MGLDNYISQEKERRRAEEKARQPFADGTPEFWAERQTLTQAELKRILALYKELHQHNILANSSQVQFLRSTTQRPERVVTAYGTTILRDGATHSSPKYTQVKSPTYILAICDGYIFRLGHYPVELASIDTLKLTSTLNGHRTNGSFVGHFKRKELNKLAWRFPNLQRLEGVNAQNVELIGQHKKDPETAQFLRATARAGWMLLLAIIFVVCSCIALAMEKLEAAGWLFAVGLGLMFVLTVMPFRKRSLTYDPFVPVPIVPGAFVTAADLA